MNKIIPECHEWSDRYFWTELFPLRYKKRTKTIIRSQKDPSLPPIVVDGDVSFEFSDDNSKRTAVCNCCGHRYQSGHGTMFGDVYVGLELVYTCPKCGDGAHRIYTYTGDGNEDELEKAQKAE